MPELPPNRITDAKALRALAHPLRWKLLDLISREGTATATQCAQEVGESVANCSYHLNTLAKYGFVEQAQGGQGREKPWRMTDRQQSWSDLDLDPEGTLAAQAATTGFLDFQLNQIRERYLTSQLEPDDWRAAVGMNSTNEWLTPDEVLLIREEITDIMARYRDRVADPDARPPGSRAVNMFLSVTVAPGIKSA
ncbi:MAG: ArsR/SmtB family transcription factor [Labedaea sp.]